MMQNEIYTGEQRDGQQYGQSDYEPASTLFYHYRWGVRELGRGPLAERLIISPAAAGDDGSLVDFESLQAAKLYSGEYPSDLVIAVRIAGDEGDTLLRLERADYPGYLAALAFSSQLTGLPVAEIQAGGHVQEEHESISWRIRQLRRMRKRGQGGSAAATILEIEIGDDFRQRHFRNVH